MLKTIKLLLPALIPAWNFFDWIAPSPRIEYALHDPTRDAPLDWREFRPRPASIPLRTRVARLFFNPSWNESLFLVSCAERIMDGQAEHSVQEILDRIEAQLSHASERPSPNSILQFQIAIVQRRNIAIVKEIRFVSPPRKLKSDRT
jgi:hypothetical protein